MTHIKKTLLGLLILTSMLLAQNEYALALDGSESFYVNDGTNNNLDVSTDWTFESWIKVNSFVSGDFECIMDRVTVFSFYLIAPNTVGDFGIRFVARNSSGSIIASVRSDGVSPGDSEAQMALNTWYHVAATYDGTTARLYINGTEYDNDTDADWALSTSTKAVNLGGRYWLNSTTGLYEYSRQLSESLIDEIRISNIARALEDLQTTTRDAPYEVDANTILLMHLDDLGDPPSYLTASSPDSLDGSRGDTGITSVDYVDVSEDLFLENRAPTIADIGFQWTDEHEAIEITTDIQDVNNDDLTLSLALLSGHATLSTAADTITITPLTGQTWDGRGEIAVTVSDGSLTDSVHFDFQDLGYQDNLHALTLDGISSVGINDDANNILDSLNDSWFLEAWINIDSTSDPGAWESIMDRRTVFSWFITPDPVEPRGDYALKFGIRIDDALGDTLSSIDHEEVALFFNRWYHIVAFYDGSSAQMWIGPRMVDSTDLGTWEFTSSSNALNIGARYWGGYERYLHGQIDEIRILTTPPASMDEWVLNPTGSQYSHNEQTVCNIHFDAGIQQFQYTSGMNFSGAVFFNNYSSSSYTHVHQSLQLDASNTNQVPFIYPIPAIMGAEQDDLEIKLFAWDNTETELFWSAQSTLPDGMLFEQQENVGIISWNPTLHQAGEYELTFEVSDGISAREVTLKNR